MEMVVDVSVNIKFQFYIVRLKGSGMFGKGKTPK